MGHCEPDNAESYGCSFKSERNYPETYTHMHRAEICHVLGTVLYAVRAVPILQVTGRSVGVENTHVFWTIDACRGTCTTH